MCYVSNTLHVIKCRLDPFKLLLRNMKTMTATTNPFFFYAALIKFYVPKHEETLNLFCGGINNDIQLQGCGVTVKCLRNSKLLTRLV